MIRPFDAEHLGERAVAYPVTEQISSNRGPSRMDRRERAASFLSVIFLLPLLYLRNNHIIYRHFLITQRFVVDFIAPLNIRVNS
jgi:hypothetical protein